jgi:Tol biopolymer transport system component
MLTNRSYPRIREASRQARGLRSGPCSSGAAESAPPAGTLLVVREVGYRVEQIFTVDSDGTRLTNLTPTYRDMAAIESATWSPDGTKIAFASSLQHPLFTRNVYVLDAGNGSRRQLTTTGWDQHPVWSPGGIKLAFLRSNGADTKVFVVGADGANERRIGGAAHVTSVDWSARDELAYADGQEIHIVEPDGTGDRIVATGRSPAWSPDGGRIAFFTSYYSGHLAVVNADGSGFRELSARPVDIDHPPPDWSPDGTRIVFTPYRTGSETKDMYIVEADGTGERLVTTSACCPAWSKDGLQIAFSDTQVVNIDGSCRRRLVPADVFGGVTYFGAEPWRPDTGGATIHCADMLLHAREPRASSACVTVSRIGSS